MRTQQESDYARFILAEVEEFVKEVDGSPVANGIHVVGGGEYKLHVGYFIGGKCVAGMILWDMALIQDVACTPSAGGHRGIWKLVEWALEHGCMVEESYNGHSLNLLIKVCEKLGLDADSLVYKEEEVNEDE